MPLPHDEKVNRGILPYLVHHSVAAGSPAAGFSAWVTVTKASFPVAEAEQAPTAKTATNATLSLTCFTDRSPALSTRGV